MDSANIPQVFDPQIETHHTCDPVTFTASEKLVLTACTRRINRRMVVDDNDKNEKEVVVSLIRTCPEV